MMPLLLSFALMLAAAPPPPAVPPGGTMQVLASSGGLLVAAPHGGFDLYSDDIARRVALLAGGGYLLASGYRTRERPINVNRPTEGVRLAPDDERRTPEAARVWEAWKARLDAERPGLYVEIHGNSRPESAGAIEVATIGVGPEDAAWLRADFARRLAFLAPGMPHLPWRIEPLDDLHYRAAGAKRDGALARVPVALHLETPYAVRGDERVRGRYADLIAGTLAAYMARRWPRR
jgi:hypothetical protein